jgi:hypothetical protein
MSKPTRKQRERHDPFNDFEVEQQDQPPPIPASTAQAPEGTETISGIELLPPSGMIPDRFQPRPLLPLELADQFYKGEIDCYKAAKAWMDLARNEEGVQQQIDQLLSMADTFDEHGQIKAITGSFVPSSNGTYIFQIETGERRFWAACLKYVKTKAQQEPNLRVEVIDRPSRYRQVIENRHAEPPSAVAQAREIAALLLEEAGVKPDSELADPYDYFRQSLDTRRPHKTWPRIEELMQLSRQRMVQLLNLLKFTTPILEMANRYHLPERVLREILSRPKSDWELLVKTAAREGLTADEVAVVQPSAGKRKARSKKSRMLPAQSAIRGLRTFARAVSKVDKQTQGDLLDELADEMMVKGEAHMVLPIMEELSRLIRARVERAD